MIGRKLHTWVGLSGRERGLAIVSIAVMTLVRLGLWLLPFRLMQRVCFHAGRSGLPGRAGVEEIVWAIRLASRYVPRSTCLVQALATQILLSRNGHPGRVHIGVALDAKRAFSAHAWVETDGKILVGGTEAPDRYAPMLVLDGKRVDG